MNVVGCSLNTLTEHYHRSFKFYGSNNGVSWELFKDALFPTEPITNIQYIKFDSPVSYRYYKIFVNDEIFAGVYTLLVEPTDLCGSLL